MQGKFDPVGFGRAQDVYEFILKYFRLSYLKVPYQIRNTKLLKPFRIGIHSIIPVYKIEVGLIEDFKSQYVSGSFNDKKEQVYTILNFPPAFALAKADPREDAKIKFEGEGGVKLDVYGDSFILKSVVINRGAHYVLVFYMNKKWFYYNASFGSVIVDYADSIAVEQIEGGYKDLINKNGEMYLFERFQ
jgi:hypothetical protein